MSYATYLVSDTVTISTNLSFDYVIFYFFQVFSHELCHVFGLGHCDYFHCFMNESGSMAEAVS